MWMSEDHNSFLCIVLALCGKAAQKTGDVKNPSKANRACVQRAVITKQYSTFYICNSNPSIGNRDFLLRFNVNLRVMHN